ncbi:MAG: CatA-like O-acetyltransferase [Bacillota bacterium]|nr:CatA-like O-acetyltransferase [Bacillota bacterium]
MKKINIETWNRKEIFDFFSPISNPFYMVTFRQDVTDLYNYVKEKNLSFYYSMCYLVTKAMNQVDAFQYVIQEQEVYKIEGRNPSFTDLKENAEVFHIVTMKLEGTIDEFCLRAKETSENQKGFIDMNAETEDLLYISCLPWLDITGITNERDLLAPNAKDDSVPRIAWGKYVEENGRKVLGISLEVNHRLIDGVHIGMFAQKLSEEIQKLVEKE